MRLRGVSAPTSPSTFLKTKYTFISADLGEFDTNSATWTVTIPQGWNVVMTIEDGQQNDAWSQPVRTHISSYCHVSHDVTLYIFRS